MRLLLSDGEKNTTFVKNLLKPLYVMKKHLSLLFFLAAVVGLSAKTIDTKDLTVTAPDTWIATALSFKI